MQTLLINCEGFPGELTLGLTAFFRIWLPRSLTQLFSHLNEQKKWMALVVEMPTVLGYSLGVCIFK